MARPPASRPSDARGAAAKRAAPQSPPPPHVQVPETNRNGKKATLALALVAMMALAVFERPIFILMLFALVPSMLAWLADNTPGQSLIRTVAPLNLASSLPFAIKLWHEHNSMDQVFVFMAGTYTWVALYGAAVFGWALYYLAPAIITQVVARRIERMRNQALDRQQTLKDEWGEEVER